MGKNTDLDKLFLLSYTCIGYDGMRHSCHAWFSTEERMKSFAKKSSEDKKGFEIDVSLEILSYRKIVF